MNYKNIHLDIGTAIAWGTPDKDSCGYTPAEYNKVLKKSLAYIRHLESLLKENNVPIPMQIKESYKDI